MVAEASNLLDEPRRDVRGTSVVLVHRKGLASETHHLVVSLGTRKDTVVVNLQGYDGRPYHSGTAGEDVFDTEAQALEHLHVDDGFELTRGVAVLGYAPIGNRGMLLLATRVKTVITLPGGHEVKLVAGSKWATIPLQRKDARDDVLTRAELDRLALLAEYTLDNAHFYCETADITRPFPSAAPISQPSWEFVWNNWLGASLRKEGLGHLCPPLLQGMAASKEFMDRSGTRFSLALLSRRSCLHPGMRYIARGLNELASPGNECECEQLVWTSPAGGRGEVQWCNFTWRRGTVPIWWGVKMKNGGFGDADVFISSDNPFRGTRRYFRRLQKRYAAQQRAGRAADSPPDRSQQQVQQRDGEQQRQQEADGSRQYPITCINLLRCLDPLKGDYKLSEHFQAGVRQLRQSGGGRLPVGMQNFDWHQRMNDFRDKGLGEKGMVHAFWGILQHIVPSCGMATGSVSTSSAGRSGSTDERASSSANGAVAAPVQADTPWAGGGRVRWQRQQDGMLRFNCADSLDRTNAASYFVAVQVLVEQCRQLGIQLDAVRCDPALPKGWEQRRDRGTNAIFYIDHNTRQTFHEEDLPAEVLECVLTARAPPAAAPSSASGQPPLHSSASSVSNRGGLEPAAQSRQGGANGGGYGLFGCTVDQVQERLQPDVVVEHAGFFRVNGDMIAHLYTSSRAMHSEILSLLLPPTERLASNALALGGLNKLQNLSITLQRRWSNVRTDFQRQEIVEMFLGLRLSHHLPTSQPLYAATPPLETESDEEEPSPTARRLAGGGSAASLAPAGAPAGIPDQLLNMQTAAHPQRLEQQPPAAVQNGTTEEDPALSQQEFNCSEASGGGGSPGSCAGGSGAAAASFAAAEEADLLGDLLGLQDDGPPAAEAQQPVSKPRQIDHPLSLI